MHCGDGVPFSCSLSIWDMYCLSWWKAGQQLIPAAEISPRKPDTGLDPVARDLVAGESILGQWWQLLEVCDGPGSWRSGRCRDSLYWVILGWFGCSPRLVSLLEGTGCGEGNGSCFLLTPAEGWINFCGFKSQAAQHVRGSVMSPDRCLCVVLQVMPSVGLSFRPKQGTQSWKCGYHRLHTLAVLEKGCAFSTSRLSIWTWIALMWLLGRAVPGVPARAVLTLCFTVMSLPWKKICLVPENAQLQH